MSNRQVRVNELIKREISELLHTRYKDDAVAITVTDVDVSPDLRNAGVYYSVIGDEAVSWKARRFFQQKGEELRRLVGKRVILKYLPHFLYKEDDSIQRGHRIIEILDELDAESDH